MPVPHTPIISNTVFGARTPDTEEKSDSFLFDLKAPEAAKDDLHIAPADSFAPLTTSVDRLPVEDDFTSYMIADGFDFG